MKKTYIKVNGEKFKLFTGVNAVWDGWLLETNGGATCENEMEDCVSDGVAGAAEELARIHATIDKPEIPWKHCTARDKKWVYDTLEAWGIS